MDGDTPRPLFVRPTVGGKSEAGIEGHDPDEGDAEKLTTSDSESHQMIAKMRFLE